MKIPIDSFINCEHLSDFVFEVSGKKLKKESIPDNLFPLSFNDFISKEVINLDLETKD